MKIALAGNPNSGKTTLFNVLTGSNQFVGNWPGVTVEKKEGKLKGHKGISVIDLPGIYSLSPYTPEEVITRKFLLEEQPDVILNIVDGTNLERNLYLTTQLLELGIPLVLAVNMGDVLAKSGDNIDYAKLGKALGCQVVAISALKGTGIKEMVDEVLAVGRENKLHGIMHKYSGSVEHTLAHIEEALLHDLPLNQQRWYAIKIFEQDELVMQKFQAFGAELEHIKKDIAECEKEMDDDAESIIIAERYSFIEKVIKDCLRRTGKSKMSTSDKIDRIVTNRFLALPIFAVIMTAVYYISVTTVGTWVTEWTNDVLFGEIIPPAIESFLVAVGCAPLLQSLILDGIVAGVGAVLGFVPQIFVLFIFLAFLESCGYMARIAFIMDRIFRRFGLSGKSFIPMLIGTGCGIPGIMASRTIENTRDRRVTIMTTTFIPCGAKLPFIALMAGAVFGGAWWVAPSAYFMGIAAIICSGIILKKTRMFAGEVAPFVMELPAYHWPTVGNVLRSMWERGWSFIKKAGTIILLSTIVIWFLSGFGFTDQGFGVTDDINQSLLAAVGSAFAVIFAPLGWGSWEYSVATIGGLVAKENIVATLGIIFGFAEVAEDGVEIWGLLGAQLTVVSGYSFLIFNLLCAPCFAAMGAIRREMNNGKWTAFAIGYQCAFAYFVAFTINQLGNLFLFGIFGIGTVIALIALAGFVYLLVRKSPEEKLEKTAAKLIAE